jgi:hypothetical protein
VTYTFAGALDEIYATLVVRLHYTKAFEVDQLWRFAADYKTDSGKRLGLKMNVKAEGQAELELYFESGIAEETQVAFIRYVNEHLERRAQDVVRRRHYVCPYCQTPVEAHGIVEMRLKKGLKDVLCLACEERVPLIDLIEQKFASVESRALARKMDEEATAAIDNESRELILVGHAFAIAGEAGQIHRGYTNSDHGIDGEIEFKDDDNRATGRRLYLQLKSGDSYLHKRKDGTEVFQIKEPRWADYWQQQAYPVMLVVRTSDGTIRWMDVSAYLKNKSGPGKKRVTQIVFEGEPFTALGVRKIREAVLRRKK